MITTTTIINNETASDILRGHGYSVQVETAGTVLVTRRDRPALHERFDSQRQAVVRLQLALEGERQ